MKRELAAEIGRARDAVAGDDLRLHIDFVQTAVEQDDPHLFRDYALWCRDLPGSRGVDAVTLIGSLETIRAELTGRLSPPAAEAAHEAVCAGIDALSAGEASPCAKDAPHSLACHLYVAAAVSGRREAALAIVRESVGDAESPVEMYVEIFQSALYEVGRRWQTAGLTVAEEHMATATTQFILSVLHQERPRTAGRRGTAVVTGVFGDQHVVGANIVANVLDADGWDVRYVGTNLPIDDIVGAVSSTQADLLAVSVTRPECVDAARELIDRVRDIGPTPPRVIVGGAPFREDPLLWRAVGADGFAADARSVADVAVAGTAQG
ncbi:cobalamin B12-binding domain-containing protein [Nocardioides piscis]|uniref:B12-binding domain-containing protein n=1 Tax=Nocardioides piscis TaxID=2714938 RepID=A0A6G7YD60_9ACTN|nr:cobalamin-dependent protein [Nocardioides piscis]QIK74581.1 hypothetical protein G7071_03185 [Nocardioides piscis]